MCFLKIILSTHCDATIGENIKTGHQHKPPEQASHSASVSVVLTRRRFRGRRLEVEGRSHDVIDTQSIRIRRLHENARAAISEQTHKIHALFFPRSSTLCNISEISVNRQL